MAVLRGLVWSTSWTWLLTTLFCQHQFVWCQRAALTPSATVRVVQVGVVWRSAMGPYECSIALTLLCKCGEDYSCNVDGSYQLFALKFNDCTVTSAPLEFTLVVQDWLAVASQFILFTEGDDCERKPTAEGSDKEKTNALTYSLLLRSLRQRLWRTSHLRQVCPTCRRHRPCPRLRQSAGTPRPQRDRRKNTPLGQRSRVGGSTIQTHSLLEYPRVSCVREPVALLYFSSRPLVTFCRSLDLIVLFSCVFLIDFSIFLSFFWATLA